MIFAAEIVAAVFALSTVILFFIGSLISLADGEDLIGFFLGLFVAGAVLFGFVNLLELMIHNGFPS